MTSSLSFAPQQLLNGVMESISTGFQSTLVGYLQNEIQQFNQWLIIGKYDHPGLHRRFIPEGAANALQSSVQGNDYIVNLTGASGITLDEDQQTFFNQLVHNAINMFMTTIQA